MAEAAIERKSDKTCLSGTDNGKPGALPADAIEEPAAAPRGAGVN
jgi:hypothetical protein